MSTRLVGAIVLGFALLGATASRARDTLTLETVLGRLHGYLSGYAERLPATIATEHYEQKVDSDSSRERVVLESEFGIIRLAGGWLGFRDVLTVNGTPVADHEQTLERLFANPSVPAIEQARRIARQNARFNIGPIERTINDPAVVLELLDARNASRMRFAKTGEATVSDVRVWTIKFEERRRPTIIRTTGGRDRPANGTAWVDPVTGRLVRAEATIDNESTRIGLINNVGFTATIDVVFKDEPRVGFWVPSEMTERYEEWNLRSSSGHVSADFAWEFQKGRGSHAQSPRAAENACFRADSQVRGSSLAFAREHLFRPCPQCNRQSKRPTIGLGSGFRSRIQRTRPTCRPLSPET